MQSIILALGEKIPTKKCSVKSYEKEHLRLLKGPQIIAGYKKYLVKLPKAT